jgi:hypothetical protein
MSDEETVGQPEGNQEGSTGQAQGNQGQAAPATNQPNDVELADGTRVTLEELKSGFMKDADYRRKTADIAEERRRLQVERDTERRMVRSQANTEPATAPDEEANPLDIVVRELIGVKTYIARQYLNGEINKLQTKYPEADPESVFASCWANPNASIEDEMTRSHESISRRIGEKTAKGQPPATLEEFFKQNPKAKEEYDRKQQDEYLRKKAQKSSEAKTVAATGSSGSSETFREPVKKATSYREVSERLKARLAEEKDESF